MQKILILAGHREQYEQWLADNGHTSQTAFHGYDQERIISVEVTSVLTVGTFWERKDAHKLFQLAQTRIRKDAR